jgi:hypothetical protein
VTFLRLCNIFASSANVVDIATSQSDLYHRGSGICDLRAQTLCVHVASLRLAFNGLPCPEEIAAEMVSINRRRQNNPRTDVHR